MPFLLPPPPKSWDKDKDFKIHAKSLAAYEQVKIEPCGKEFMNVIRRIRMNRTLEEDLELEAALHAAEDEDVNMEEDEPETKKLLASDPHNWKNQDHYAVLGISKLRYKANDDDIKRAYRRKVLKHHPDKKAASSGKTNDDSFFKCIQKAWEILSDPVKRRQWDSVDPKFDEALPTSRPLKAGEDFFEIFGPAFEKESRFSKEPLPPFGGPDATREEVEDFYQSWFSIDSWRTFELMDEEEESSGDSREEKRYYERKNRAARLKLKKEDNARVLRRRRRLPRRAKRKEKEYAAQASQREAAQKAEEEKIAKEKEEKEEKDRREIEKKEKELQKKLMKKAKKEVKTIFKDNNNFLPANAPLSKVEDHLAKLEILLENSELWHLEEFKFRLDQVAPKGLAALQACFEEELGSVEERKETIARNAEALKQASQSATAAAAAALAARRIKLPWTAKEQAMLIKAVKQHPGGTNQRWEKIAEYVNLHGGEEGEDPSTRTRGPDECIKKSKELQAVSTAERAALQDVIAGKKKDVDVKDAPTNRDVVNTDLPIVAPKGSVNGAANGTATPKTAPATPAGKKAARPAGFVVPENDSWTAAQQAQLEQALRKFPAVQFAAAPSERWEKIAEEIDGKEQEGG
ncbi:hypothetical protein BC829DRAFT_439823 [Chytridium lagenaria]|nr:hypothetical protein BC829DRAFT_439823 [Chytridium lagenaria]